MFKITVQSLKPRNPLVVASRFRKAGVHEMSGRARRQQAQHSLQRELRALEHPRPRQSP